MSALAKTIVMLGVIGALGSLSGCCDRGRACAPCAEVRHGPAHPLCRSSCERTPTARPQQRAGGSWNLVFAAPETVGAAGASDPRQFAEYSRNDASLSARPEEPLLATTEWPERERASLAYPRRVYLETRADQLLFFENESKYRAWGWGGYRGSAITPTQGVYGFWR